MDFTPEQEAEIQKRIEAAKQEQQALEQYRISGDMFFREGIAAAAMKVQQGIISPFVLEVGKDQYSRYLGLFFQQGAPAPEQEPAGAKDDEQTD